MWGELSPFGGRGGEFRKKAKGQTEGIYTGKKTGHLTERRAGEGGNPFTYERNRDFNFEGMAPTSVLKGTGAPTFRRRKEEHGVTSYNLEPLFQYPISVGN